MAKKPSTIDVKVRMPRDLQRRIARQAETRGQTINAEILNRLDESFGTQSILRDVQQRLLSEDFIVSWVAKKYGVRAEDILSALRGERRKLHGAESERPNERPSQS